MIEQNMSVAKAVIDWKAVGERIITAHFQTRHRGMPNLP